MTDFVIIQNEIRISSIILLIILVKLKFYIIGLIDIK